MAFDAEGFKIVEKGYQEDLEKLRAQAQKEAAQELHTQQQGKDQANVQKRMHAGMSPPGMDHMQRKAVADTEQVISQEQKKREEERKRLYQEKIKQREQDLEKSVYGEVGKRKEQLEKMRQYEAAKAQSEKARTEFNQKAEQRTRDKFNAASAQKESTRRENATIRETSRQELEAARVEFKAGREAKKPEMQRPKDQGRSY